MLNCSFKLNGKALSEVKIGASAWPAFSGYGSHVNKREFQCVADSGPIPPGMYYIVDRQSGGLLGALRDHFNGHDQWFALYADDGTVNDEMLCEQIKRGKFRLHPPGYAGISKGCLTFSDKHNFQLAATMLRGSSKIAVPGSSLQAYGKMSVQ